MRSGILILAEGTRCMSLAIVTVILGIILLGHYDIRSDILNKIKFKKKKLN